MDGELGEGDCKQSSEPVPHWAEMEVWLARQQGELVQSLCKRMAKVVEKHRARRGVVILQKLFCLSFNCW